MNSGFMAISITFYSIHFVLVRSALGFAHWDAEIAQEEVYRRNEAETKLNW
jgi:hypothetical protein